MGKHFNLSDRIQHIILLKSKFLSDFGLFNGKTGVAILYAHLHQQTHNSLYDDCMSELLDDVLERTYVGLGVDFASGFSGIGWGIEYLIQNGFVEGNSAKICEELDRKIMEKDPRRITDISLEVGLEGLLHYLLAHLSGTIRDGKSLPFDEMYLRDLNTMVESMHKDRLSSSLNLLIDKYMSWYNDRLTLDYQMNITSFINQIEIDEKRLSEYPLGVRNGLSGILLKQFIR